MRVRIGQSPSASWETAACGATSFGTLRRILARGAGLLLTLGAALVLTGCGGGIADSLGLKGDEGSRFRDEQTEATEVFALTNARRTEAGLPPLVWEPEIQAIAYAHSVTMEASGQLSHLGPDGSNASARMDRAGYAHIRWTENVAWGHGGGAAEVVDAWMRSEFHRANILHPDMTHVGVGVRHNPASTQPGPWWTQDFAIPAE